MASNAIAIFFGEKFLSRIPMQWVRRIACAMFMIFGILILIGYFMRAG
ncbi:MAG: TMEM165/GDT1 family protein, partial [Bdellovibrio sp.]|nr:TMEM165/GDT1 family protein [Bdellovibrio sp.]